MKTAFVYIMTSLTLTIILVLAHSKGHERTKDAEIFRYQPGLLKVLMFLTPTPMIMVAFVWFVTIPRMEGLSKIGLFLIGVFFSVVISVGFLHLREVYYEICESSINFVKKTKILKIKWNEIGKVVYSTVGRDGGSIRIYAMDGKQQMYIPGTFQDLDVMASLLKKRSMQYKFDYVE